jgi:hypothetical protein
VNGTEDIVTWIKTASASVAQTREPTISVPLFDNYVLSLLRLGHGLKEPKRFAPDWNPQELEDIAALLLATVLFRRARAGTTVPAASSEEGEQAAARRGWNVVEDAISELKDFENEIVELGAAVLSGQPDLLKTWLEDTDDGSFPDAAGDVRRRLDFVVGHEDKFANTVVDKPMRDRGESLLADAGAFYRGREGRGTPKTQLTLARDQAFTLLMERLPRLQLVLRAAYRGNAEAREKIDGGYWRRLQRLSMPRRKRKEQGGES